MKTLIAGDRKPFSLAQGMLMALALGCFFGAYITTDASAATLPSTISETTTLTAAESPYEGSWVTVASKATLHIEPGVTVRLNGGELAVEGTLDAAGTKGSPVVLTSSSDSAPNQWWGVAFVAGSGGSTMSHVELRYARNGVRVFNASPSIVHSSIHDNSENGVTVRGGSPQIDDNAILNNSGEGIAVIEGGSSQIASSERSVLCSCSAG